MTIVVAPHLEQLRHSRLPGGEAEHRAAQRAFKGRNGQLEPRPGQWGPETAVLLGGAVVPLRPVCGRGAARSSCWRLQLGGRAPHAYGRVLLRAAGHAGECLGREISAPPLPRLTNKI
jgi:hypothetical protein